MRGDAVTAETSIEASTEIVWRFLTVERGLWWPEMTFEAVVGSPLVETWTEDGREMSATGLVTHSVEHRLLGFRWIEPEWRHSLEVTIRLVPDDRATTVILRESGFVRARTPLSLPDEHQDGWTCHLARLKRVSEGGSA